MSQRSSAKSLEKHLPERDRRWPQEPRTPNPEPWTTCKPLQSSEVFNETLIREDLCNTLDVASGCELEIVMKDIHSLSCVPKRVARWVRLAREVCDQYT